MRLARIASPHAVAFVEIEGDPSRPTEAVCKEIKDHPFGTPEFSGRSWPLAECRLLAPILPTKIIGVGKNYAAHAVEMGGEAPAEPLLFMKPNTAVVGPEVAVRRPAGSKRVDHEVELAVVIGRPCKNLSVEEARGAILGYTIANDVTARDFQASDGQWLRAKGFDTFCPLGPWIDTALSLDDAQQLDLTCTVRHADGTVERRQDGNTAQMLHTIPEIIAYVSRIMTLLPGDTLLTGTPEGIGPIAAGDTVTCAVEGLGELTNPVAD